MAIVVTSSLTAAAARPGDTRPPALNPGPRRVGDHTHLRRVYD